MHSLLGKHFVRQHGHCSSCSLLPAVKEHKHGDCLAVVYLLISKGSPTFLLLFIAKQLKHAEFVTVVNIDTTSIVFMAICSSRTSQITFMHPVKILQNHNGEIPCNT